MEKYYVSSHDYLDRALQLLQSESPAQWFYAAFELRCGIEARMAEYLGVWDHISAKKKKGWRIAEMHRNVEKAFRTGSKIVRWAVHNKDDDSLALCFYHTPVTTKLKNNGQRLGNYLHSLRKYRTPDDDWWVGFKAELSQTAVRLRTATTGTLLGPPLIKLNTTDIDMKMEVPAGLELETIMDRLKGREVKIKVSYLDRLLDPIEAEAVAWHAGGYQQESDGN